MIGTRTRILTVALATAGMTVGYAAPAAAQATRTWVSGVGDDVNPCSRTAPCKTFAGAISKTAAGGEINCLDPGGFGAVTITKSMTIDCHYTEGGALAGGNGITVNALSTDTVVIRGLDIFGVNPPSNGVRVLVAAAVHIEDCVIRRFNAANSFGISFQPSGTTNLYVTNTRVTHNGNGATGGGMLIKPTGTGNARATVQNTQIQHNTNYGISVDTTGSSASGSVALVLDSSQVTGSSVTGINALAPVGAAPIFGMVTNSIIAHNVLAGYNGDGSTVTFRFGNNTITGNSFGGASAVQSQNGAVARSYFDNRLDGNANDGGFTSTIPKK
ncbi:MAG TPA: hypothetical protein VF620_13285 [Allosphingosinicella sp.]|jgi:hypothetical protein